MTMLKRSEQRFPIWTRWTTALSQTFAIVEADIRKLRHDPYELITRMIQPTIWLLIFGQAMEKAHAIPTGELSYLDFIAPGILAQSVLFISIFYGIALIWERDKGILHKILVTPAPRAALVIGRAIAGGIRSLSQVILIYVLSFILGVHLKIEFFSIIGVLGMVVLGGAIFSTLSLIAASIVKKRERFMGIGQALTMPLFFASNALYPLQIMPEWIRTLSVWNPLSYLVDALRSLMIVGDHSAFGLATDIGVSLFFFVVLVAIATRTYPKILY